MNYTDLNEDQKFDVLEVILEDCDDELKWDDIPVNRADELARKYPTKYAQELFREANTPWEGRTIY